MFRIIMGVPEKRGHRALPGQESRVVRRALQVSRQVQLPAQHAALPLLTCESAGWWSSVLDFQDECPRCTGFHYGQPTYKQ